MPESALPSGALVSKFILYLDVGLGLCLSGFGTVVNSFELVVFILHDVNNEEQFAKTVLIESVPPMPHGPSLSP